MLILASLRVSFSGRMGHFQCPDGSSTLPTRTLIVFINNFMSLENFSAPEVPETNPNSQKSPLLEKIKKYLRVATVVGIASFAGKEAIIGVKHEINYKKYFDATSSDQEKGYQRMRAQLLELVGEKAVQQLERGDKRAFMERSDKEKLLPELYGFEKLGLDNEKLKEIWSEDNGTYPKSWINGEISLVYYKDEKVEMPEHYGENLRRGKAEGSYHQRIMKFYGLPGGIKTSNLSKDEIIMFLELTFAHEIGHANDWEEDADMEITERQSLLLKVLKRVQSKKPFKSEMDTVLNNSSYTEKIQNSDTQENLHLKAKEYWADICKEYFGNVEWLQEKYPEDFKIVDDFVKKYDSDFNPALSRKLRYDLSKR